MILDVFLLKINPFRAEIDDFKNAFVSLALPLWVLSEPLPPVKTTSKEHDPIVMGPVKARPEGFTSWDKARVKEGSIQQILKSLVLIYFKSF